MRAKKIWLLITIVGRCLGDALARSLTHDGARVILSNCGSQSVPPLLQLTTSEQPADAAQPSNPHGHVR